jgi:twitching motility protein PilI
MARRTGLREFQISVAERLRNAATRTTLASKLGFQVGADNWFVALHQVSEVIPIPPMVQVPLTHSWFRGVANVRGNLYSVVDFPAFLGNAPVTLNEQSRLLLLGERFRTASALLVDRSLGLRNAAQLKALDSSSPAAWVRAQYEDDEGKKWLELDLGQLVQQEEFLNVGT